MDLISRQAAIDAVKEAYENDELFDGYEYRINELPSAQPQDWIAQNKDRILQAGMEGREVEFRICGRLFAIREKAQ